MLRLSLVLVALMLTTVNAQNLECALIVPTNPLTSVGLSTPYQLQAFNPNNGPCNMANPNQQGFVNGLILDTDTGNFFIYNPLVIDTGTTPAVVPTAPLLPADNIVALWFGTNANIQHLIPTPTQVLPDSLQQGFCVFAVLNGNMTDIFSQFAFCNAPALFQKARALVAAGTIKVPPLGTAKDGQPCPTIRDFSLVDQDQSDNVPTSYLLVTTAVTIGGVTINAGTTAQNTAANRALLTTNAMVIANPSDERLLAIAVDSAIGCTPWQAPDLADASTLNAALGLNELHAFYVQAQPIAFVPALDPFASTNGVANLVKLNAYRIGVGQPGVTQLSDADTTVYCQALATIAPPRFNTLKQFWILAASPVPTVATNLWGFMVQRFAATWGAGGLNCQALTGLASPITSIFNAGGLTSDGLVTVLGNLIPASAYAPGGAFSAQLAGESALGGTVSGTSTISPAVIGLAVALGVVCLIDIVVLIWWLCAGRSSGGGSSSSYNPKYSEKDTYVSGPNDGGQTNYPLSPVGGNGGQRQSVFMRMRQWV